MEEKDIKDIINKLETVRLPEAGLPQYKNRLKMTLLQGAHKTGHIEKNKTKGVFGVMKDILTSRQPVWRTALVAILAVALVTGLMVAFPLKTVPASAELTDEALALYIVQNSDIVIEAAGDEEESKISEVSIACADDENMVVKITAVSLSDLAQETTLRSWEIRIRVNLEEERITSYYFRRDHVNETETERIDEVLQADSRTKALLDAGAETIYEGEAGYMGVHGSGRYILNETTGEMELEATKIIKTGLKLGDEYYEAQLELVEGVVGEFGNPLFSLMSAEEIDAVESALQRDPEIKALLDAGAVIEVMACNMIKFEVVEEGSGEYSGISMKGVQVIMELDGVKYEAHVRINYDPAADSWSGELLYFMVIGSPEYEEKHSVAPSVNAPTVTVYAPTFTPVETR